MLGYVKIKLITLCENYFHKIPDVTLHMTCFEAITFKYAFIMYLILV